MKDSIINGALSLGSGVLGGMLGLIGAKKQRDFEVEQASAEREFSESMIDKQNQWNLEQWNRQNEYNSPLSQRQRLEEAGLNPLYYNLDGSSSSSLESAQPLGYERASMSGIENPMAAGITAALQTAQLQNIQADTAKKNNENVSVTAEREKTIIETNKLKQDIQNLLANRELTEAQTANLNKVLEWADTLNQAALGLQESQSNLNRATQNRIETLLEGEKNIQVKTLKDFEYRWNKVEAELKKISVETGISQKDLENYALNHMQNGAFGSGMSFINLLRLSIENVGSVPGNPSELSEDVNYPDMGMK